MGFHCRIKVEFFRYDLRKFIFIFCGIETEDKHNMKRKAKLLMGFRRSGQKGSVKVEIKLHRV